MQKWVVGIDEVGRGPFAGPVYVCVVCMHYDYYKKNKNTWIGLTDSKKMTKKNRELWFAKAKEMSCDKKMVQKIFFSVESQTAKYIDKNGISQAIKKCIVQGLEKLHIDQNNSVILLDGSLKAPEVFKNQKTIIKGDSKEKIISLASVIAKVSRDRYMDTLSKKYLIYKWGQNKGYGTKEHSRVILKNGITSYHRKSFLKNLLPNL